ncbi:DUF1990 family protein [Nocardioides sp. NPDC057767]|uniref:DUF1990 family protein n=1 Tax=unclassified Nocardioides TaxID=2615069 RepID=UPI00366FE03A
MDVQELPEDEATRLRSAAYTYEEVGNTAIGPVAGFNWFERSAILQRRDFERAAQDLLSWQVQARSGLHVSASHTPLQPATVVLMRLGPSPLSLRIPCRVVYLIDDGDLRGFAYGTLPGHPEAGEERFALRRHASGSLELTISAFSRPASNVAKLGGPISRVVQDAMTRRYLRALDMP